MAEIAKCRFCKSTPFYYGERQYWRCADLNCLATGPNNDPDGAKWNAMMRCDATPAPPAARTVRVRIPVYPAGSGRLAIHMQYRPDKGWRDVIANEYLNVIDPVAYITADIPLPQPVEIPGTVEANDGE